MHSRLHSLREATNVDWLFVDDNARKCRDSYQSELEVLCGNLCMFLLHTAGALASSLGVVGIGKKEVDIICMLYMWALHVLLPTLLRRGVLAGLLLGRCCNPKNVIKPFPGLHTYYHGRALQTHSYLTYNSSGHYMYTSFITHILHI